MLQVKLFTWQNSQLIVCNSTQLQATASLGSFMVTGVYTGYTGTMSILPKMAEIFFIFCLQWRHSELVEPVTSNTGWRPNLYFGGRLFWWKGILLRQKACARAAIAHDARASNATARLQTNLPFLWGGGWSCGMWQRGSSAKGRSEEGSEVGLSLTGSIWTRSVNTFVPFLRRWIINSCKSQLSTSKIKIGPNFPFLPPQHWKFNESLAFIKMTHCFNNVVTKAYSVRKWGKQQNVMINGCKMVDTVPEQGALGWWRGLEPALCEERPVDVGILTPETSGDACNLQQYSTHSLHKYRLVIVYNVQESVISKSLYRISQLGRSYCSHYAKGKG